MTQRQKDPTFRTLSDEDARSVIGEGLHTGLRKGSDAPSSITIWNAINDSKDGAWSDALAFLVDGLHYMGITLVQEVKARDRLTS